MSALLVPEVCIRESTSVASTNVGMCAIVEPDIEVMIEHLNDLS